MPVKATTYILGQGDILLIEDCKIRADDIDSYSVNYDPSKTNADSFRYTFQIAFKGSEGIMMFKKIRSGLERNESITWYNPSQDGSMSLQIEDALVELSDEDMEKQGRQTLRLVTFAESQELKEGDASQ